MSERQPLFAGFADEVRAPDRPWIAPDRFAHAMHLQVQDLARLAKVHRSTVTENPGNSRLQDFMRDAVRVINAAEEVSGSQGKAIYWYRNSPIPEFGQKTAEELVAVGKVRAVLRYLESVESGTTG